MPGAVQNTEEGWKDGKALHQGQQLAMARGEQRESNAAEPFSTAVIALCRLLTAVKLFHRRQEKDFRKGGFWEGSEGSKFVCIEFPIMGKEQHGRQQKNPWLKT